MERYVESYRVEMQAFVDAVFDELENLHEGNFARYQIRPAEFERWRQVWTSNR